MSVFDGFLMEILLVLIFNAYLIGGIIIAFMVKRSRDDKNKDI